MVRPMDDSDIPRDDVDLAANSRTFPPVIYGLHASEQSDPPLGSVVVSSPPAVAALHWNRDPSCSAGSGASAAMPMSRQELEDIRAECMADDIDIPDEAESWIPSEARTFFER